MEEHPELRLAVRAWLRQARDLTPIPQAITDIALITRLEEEWEALSNAVVAAAPIGQHRDLYGKQDGDWLPTHRTLLGASGLGDATRLIAQGVQVTEEEVLDSFVAFCSAPAPTSEDWLLLNAEFPQGARILLGRYTLQTFTPDELRRLGPMPAIHDLAPGRLNLALLDGAPFLHVPDPDRRSTRGTRWFGATGPRPEARHWQALLPLILWDPELLRVETVFDVERGRRFDLRPNDVPITYLSIVCGPEEDDVEEIEVRQTGDYHVSSAELPDLQAFCTAINAKIDALMTGTASLPRLPRRRARRLERAARHLLHAYQRTFSDYGVWEDEEADELHLDYVIALEALMASPNDSRGGGGTCPQCNHSTPGISENIRTRASALFLTDDRRREAEEIVKRAYSARSTYVHGDVIKDQNPGEKLQDLHRLRLLTLEITLRWLALTPADTEDLAPLLDAAAIGGTDHNRIVREPLTAFLQASPPRTLPQDLAPA
ncbi:HEPN domain-containing protein (plasmid) [Streptomyces scopuliridis]|uniref:hypothetical protein n=1 Tax=Streptomyces scopuliridis TaxID=452529 RepID=UPI002DD98B44|nr:hypothetical protein [Streptomyces scopuliridis]WSB39205.1 HEPN domain-containing protein [Streptomyces scopuliridis]